MMKEPRVSLVGLPWFPQRVQMTDFMMPNSWSDGQERDMRVSARNNITRPGVRLAGVIGGAVSFWRGML
jgi:hypothetical protein